MGQEDSYPDSLYHSCCMVCAQVECQCTHGLRGSFVMANEQHLAEGVSVPGSYCTPMHHCMWCDCNVRVCTLTVCPLTDSVSDSLCGDEVIDTDRQTVCTFCK